MGPHRIIHNTKGYLTETFFDTATGRFRERPFPPKPDAPPPKPSDAIALPRTVLRDSDLTRETAMFDNTKKTGADGSSMPFADDHDAGAPQC